MANQSSPVRHVIIRNVFGFNDAIAIEPEEYSQIVTSKKILLATLALEEKFSILIDNYAEYERSLLDLALSKMLCFDFEWSSMRDDAQLVNRRLANLLTAARMYVNRVKSDVRAICSDSTAVDEVAAAINTQYDTRLGYRVMEALRNYAQHRSLPVAGISYPGSRDERKGRVLLRHTITVNLDVSQLSDDPKFKATVRAELLAGDKHPPITPLVRDYIEGLGAVHDVVRAKTATRSDDAERVLAAVVEKALARWDSDAGLCVATEDADGFWWDLHGIFLDLGKRRRNLVARTPTPRYLRDSYVSNEPPGL